MPKLCYGSPFWPDPPKREDYSYVAYEDIVEDLFQCAANGVSPGSCIYSPDLVKTAQRVWWFLTKMDVHPSEFSDQFQKNLVKLELAKEKPEGGYIYKGLDYE